MDQLYGVDRGPAGRLQSLLKALDGMTVVLPGAHIPLSSLFDFSKHGETVTLTQFKLPEIEAQRNALVLYLHALVSNKQLQPNGSIHRG